jgi:hypothetical protein
MQPFIRQGWVVKALLGADSSIAFIAYKAAMLVTTTIMQLGLTARDASRRGSARSRSSCSRSRSGRLRLSLQARRLVPRCRRCDVEGRADRCARDEDGRRSSVVFDWIKSNWPLLLGILTGPFGSRRADHPHFGKIKAAYSGVFIDTINFVAVRALDPRT